MPETFTQIQVSVQAYDLGDLHRPAIGPTGKSHSDLFSLGYLLGLSDSDLGKILRTVLLRAVESQIRGKGE